MTARARAEQRRLADIAAGRGDWQHWGTYVSDRAWGTVREDYSADGNAWDYFPHDHARSRAYRWNEDGLAGFCDRDQILCLGLALWNGCDPILKERMSWDLAFQAVVMATIDPAFAKSQMMLLAAPRSQHPYGTVPAYEWDFNAVNPPVLAWAVWQIYQLEWRLRGTADIAFLKAMFDPLLMMLTWWLNRKDGEGKGIFSGGFLGLDNIGVFDRGQPLPTGGSLEQGDATGWMAMFQLNMAAIAFELALHDPHYEPMVHRFGQDFVIVAGVMQRTSGGGIGLWNEEHGFYFDVIRHDNERVPLKIYSMVGLVPLFAAAVVEPSTLAKLPVVMQTVGNVLNRREFLKSILPTFVEAGEDGTRLLAVVNRTRLAAILQRVLDEAQFLSEYGVRSLSRAHAAHPYSFEIGGQRHDVAYLPGVSDNRMFGGNSNWRGPIWFPMNFLLIQALATSARYYGDSFTVECPTGSGRFLSLQAVADELADRFEARLRARRPKRWPAGRVRRQRVLPERRALARLRAVS